MVSGPSNPPQCPRCGSSDVTLCGQSTDYRPEQWSGQPLNEREVHTLAYKCGECGIGFTATANGNSGAGEGNGDQPPQK